MCVCMCAHNQRRETLVSVSESKENTGAKVILTSSPTTASLSLAVICASNEKLDESLSLAVICASSFSKGWMRACDRG